VSYAQIRTRSLITLLITKKVFFYRNSARLLQLCPFLTVMIMKADLC